MELEPLRRDLLARPGTTEETPFGPEALVYKVMGKMYVLLAWDQDPMHITLKCDPDLALFLRDMYPAVRPGRYMHKAHWNTITMDGSVPDPELMSMIQDSYDLVVKGLSRKLKEQLAQLDQAG
ncbi:MAG: MmcQ/YjbR family DNA-binding protein [Chloroflexota bacterium]